MNNIVKNWFWFISSTFAYQILLALWAESCLINLLLFLFKEMRWSWASRLFFFLTSDLLCKSPDSFNIPLLLCLSQKKSIEKTTESATKWPETKKGEERKYSFADRWPLFSLLLLMTRTPSKPLIALGEECKVYGDNERWGRRQGHKGAKCQFNFRWDVNMVGRHIHDSCGLSAKWRCLPTTFSQESSFCYFLSAVFRPCFSDYPSLLVSLVTI